MSPGMATGVLELADATMHVKKSQLKKRSSPELATPADSEDLPVTIQIPLKRRKSLKRLAAEALIETKNASPAAESAQSPLNTQQRTVSVHRCDASDCKNSHICDHWCNVNISVPTIDWPTVLQSIAAAQHNPNTISSHHQQQDIHLPNGIDVRVVSHPKDVSPAITALRQSMQDNVIAIDLEWRPDYSAGNNSKVALIQLASGSMAILIRINKLNCGNALPAALTHFFSDPALTFVSYAWASADEGKMQRTFKIGAKAFHRLIDLQTISEKLGYHSYGLASLTERVLGVALPKSRKVSMSNWERHILTPAQVQYAALDALITGHVFRGLRLWHASPSPCSTCFQMFGALVCCGKKTEMQCLTCSRSFKNVTRLRDHAKEMCHTASHGVCGECGRLCQHSH